MNAPHHSVRCANYEGPGVSDNPKPDDKYVAPGTALLVLVLIVGAIITGAFGQPIAGLFLVFALLLML